MRSPCITRTPRSHSRNVDELNELWGIPGAIEFGTGQGDLPTVLLTHPQTGMQLVVYLYGATIAQWLKSDGTATFYDGPDELYDGGLPLRWVSVAFAFGWSPVMPLCWHAIRRRTLRSSQP